MTPPASLTITYKSFSSLNLPVDQGLIKLNFDADKSAEVRANEIENNPLFLELTPETNDKNSIILWLKNIIRKPIVVSIIESVITKDKKGKETEKQTLLGQASYDLLEFLTSGEIDQEVRINLLGWVWCFLKSRDKTNRGP